MMGIYRITNCNCSLLPKSTKRKYNKKQFIAYNFTLLVLNLHETLPALRRILIFAGLFTKISKQSELVQQILEEQKSGTPFIQLIERTPNVVAVMDFSFEACSNW